MSFLVREAQARLEKSPLVELSHLIDWEKLQSKMGNLGRSGYGPNGYSSIKLSKALILQESYFGYKGFMVTDCEAGYIEQIHVTPAHVSEVKELRHGIKDRRDKRLLVFVLYLEF